MVEAKRLGSLFTSSVALVHKNCTHFARFLVVVEIGGDPVEGRFDMIAQECLIYDGGSERLPC